MSEDRADPAGSHPDRAVTGSLPRFPLLVLDVEPFEVDEASALLFELGASGVEERDATTLVKGTPGKITLVGSFAERSDAEAARIELPPSWGARHDEIVGDAWRDDWKKHFRPFELFPGFVVRPPWEAYEGDARDVIELEPGRAFGTGLHETTSLVAAALREHAGLQGSPMLDVGCGSGILSIVGLRLGAASARAIDVDPDAAAVTRENAERNGLAGRVEADTAPLESIAEQYATVVANIEATVLTALAPALIRRVAPGGVLVLSGILAADVVPGQLDAVRQAYRGLSETGAPRKGEWVALVLTAATGAGATG
jgi:ribosomal protein L11 methyltransferase